ncbi:hypothetical protein STRDD11_02486 [Streptococcus sp. DD11]|nr:hypothetical protein STRDD11_02486 [Streptococcus sp. DD11]
MENKKAIKFGSGSALRRKIRSQLPLRSEQFSLNFSANGVSFNSFPDSWS